MEKNIKPCKCGMNRWKTLEKGRKWQCRGVSYPQGDTPKFCGKIREIEHYEEVK